MHISNIIRRIQILCGKCQYMHYETCTFIVFQLKKGGKVEKSSHQKFTARRVDGCITAKNKDICLVYYFFVVKMLLGNKCYTTGKPVFLSFKWCHICKEHASVGWAAEWGMWIAPMKNLPNLLCQKAYSAIDTCLVLFGGLDDWSLKKQDILAI